MSRSDTRPSTGAQTCALLLSLLVVASGSGLATATPTDSEPAASTSIAAGASQQQEAPVTTQQAAPATTAVPPTTAVETAGSSAVGTTAVNDGGRSTGSAARATTGESEPELATEVQTVAGTPEVTVAAQVTAATSTVAPSNPTVETEAAQSNTAVASGNASPSVDSNDPATVADASTATATPTPPTTAPPTTAPPTQPPSPPSSKVQSSTASATPSTIEEAAEPPATDASSTQSGTTGPATTTGRAVGESAGSDVETAVESPVEQPVDSAENAVPVDGSSASAESTPRTTEVATATDTPTQTAPTADSSPAKGDPTPGSADEAPRAVDSSGEPEVVDQVPADDNPPATTPNPTSVVQNENSIAAEGDDPTDDVTTVPETDRAGSDLNGSAVQSTLDGIETSTGSDANGSSATTFDQASRGVKGEPLRRADGALSTGTGSNVSSASSSSRATTQLSPGDTSRILTNSIESGTNGADDEEDTVENELSTLNATVATDEESALPNVDAASEPPNVSESGGPLPHNAAGEAVASRSESSVSEVSASNAAAISNDSEPVGRPATVPDPTVDSLEDNLEEEDESRQTTVGSLESLARSDDDRATARVVNDNGSIWKSADASLGNAENVSNLTIASNETGSPSETSVDATRSLAPLRVSGEGVNEDTTANLTDDIGIVADVTSSGADVQNETESVGDAVTSDELDADVRPLDGEPLANATLVDPSVEDTESVTLSTLNDTAAVASRLDAARSIAEDPTSDTTDLNEADPVNATRSIESTEIRLGTDGVVTTANETNERIDSVWERANSVDRVGSVGESLAHRVDATSNGFTDSTDDGLDESTVLNDATTAPGRIVDDIDDPATEATSQISTSTDSVVVEPIDAAPSAVARATADGLTTLDSADIEDLGTLETSDETNEFANLEALDQLRSVRSAARPTERDQRLNVDSGTIAEIPDDSLPLDEEGTRRTLQRAVTRTAREVEQSETAIDGDEGEPLTEGVRATVSEIRFSTLDRSPVASQTRDGVLGGQDERIRTGDPLEESVDASAVADSLGELSVEPTPEVTESESPVARLSPENERTVRRAATDTVRTAIPITAAEPIAEESTAGLQEIVDRQEAGITRPSRISGRPLENRDAVGVSVEDDAAVPTPAGTSVTFSDVEEEILVSATGDVEPGSEIGDAVWSDDVRAKPIQLNELGERAGSDDSSAWSASRPSIDSRSLARLARTDGSLPEWTSAREERVNREPLRAEIDPIDEWNGHDIPLERVGEITAERTEWATGHTENPRREKDDEGRWSSSDQGRLGEFVASHQLTAGDSSRDGADRSPRDGARWGEDDSRRTPDGGATLPGYSSRIGGEERSEETIDRNAHPEAFVPGTGEAEDASRSDTGDGARNRRASGGEQSDGRPQIPSDVPSTPLVGLSAVILAGAAVRALAQGGHLHVGLEPSLVRQSLRVGSRSTWSWLGRLDPRRIIPFPGYSRYDDSDPLENDNRATVYEVVNRSPGAHLAEVVDRTDIAPSTLRYHCRVLEEEGLVETFAVDGRKRLFPTDVESKELVAAMENDATAEVLTAVRRLEPVNTSDLADALNRAPSTVSHHLARLEDARLVARSREESSVLTRLTPETRATLENQDVAGVEAE